jgi:hypothetical protein
MYIRHQKRWPIWLNKNFQKCSERVCMLLHSKSICSLRRGMKSCRDSLSPSIETIMICLFYSRHVRIYKLSYSIQICSKSLTVTCKLFVMTFLLRCYTYASQNFTIRSQHFIPYYWIKTVRILCALSASDPMDIPYNIRKLPLRVG